MSQTSLNGSLDKSGKQGSALSLLLLSIVLIGALVGSFSLSDDTRAHFFLWFLAGFAALGVLALFLYAIGVLQLAGRSARNDLTKLISDGSQEATVVTDSESRVIYANAAYLTLCGASSPEAVRPVERLC
jgi:two-component system, cell cycle sensor histidine kinase and response regulator CckA